MTQAIHRALCRIGTALTLILAAHGAAHAGLVTGVWDPQFGSPLTGMSWQVQAQVQVADACSNQADGIYTTASGPCSSTQFVNTWLRLFDTGLADPNNFFGVTANSSYFSFGNALSASSVRVVAGQVVGFDTGSVFGLTFSCYSPCSTDADFFSAIPSAEGNLFGLRLTTNGPELTCVHCAPTFADSLADYHAGGNPGRPDVISSNDGLKQFLVTYVDDGNGGVTPKYADANGNPLGALLDNTGTYLGQSIDINSQVPEPPALLMACTALAVLGFFSRRRT
jgi:hypothetical protein